MRWTVSIGGGVAVFVMACGSGPGPFDSVHSFERDTASPSESSTAGGCIACGSNMRCTGTLQSVPINVVIGTLPTKNGECAISSSDVSSTDASRLRCDGKIVTVSGGNRNEPTPIETPVGTWTSAGGGFVVCVDLDCIVCTPTTDPLTHQPPEPQPQPGGNDAGVRGGVDAG